ncbi:MAG: TIGR03087 family PEP-CTERM/XrtA system glycosyltransferase [Burkholderiaceae bacterium]
MRILFVCHRFPFPPKRGGKIRPFNMIRHLAATHEVHVASIAHDDADAEGAPGIAPYCSSYLVEQPAAAVKWGRMIARLATPQPSSIAYFQSPRLARRIRALVAARRFDLILVHCAFVAPYVSAIGDVPKILDFGDIDSEKWLAYSNFKPFPQSLGFRLEGRKMRAAERRLAGQFDCCTATTRLEHESLLALGGARETGWFPNGVDTDFFCPDGEGYDPDTIAFVGRMDYYPNQQAIRNFVDDILPKVLATRPATRLLIVGANPPAAILELGKRPGVTVTGTVPDVRDHVRRAALTVAPLAIARGVQNKILESMALGVPVIATPVAAKGVDAAAPAHLLVAADDASFAASVLDLLGDPARRRQLAEAGRRQVIAAHSWAASMKRLDQIIERTVARFAPGAVATGGATGH